jgi:serine/threonine-protein kinase
LFANFVREIKLLHQVHHANIVRIFNHYLYPERFAGYILMEYIDGQPIDSFLANSPELTNELFLQAIDGFTYLERAGILHRDIRPGNVMVRTDGVLKVIDLGFGKRIENSEDFDKSISLNWWCPPPTEFKESKYDFTTEVYFVGKLFEKTIQDHEISHFKYVETLRTMCALDPAERVKKFSDVEKAILSDQFFEIGFSEGELATYRRFSDALRKQLTRIENGATYVTDFGRVISQLNDRYRAVMLEQEVPDAAVVLRCFVVGSYYYRKRGLPVDIVRNFLKLLKSATEEKGRIVLANLHTKLDAVPRYQESDEEIPF